MIKFSSSIKDLVFLFADYFKDNFSSAAFRNGYDLSKIVSFFYFESLQISNEDLAISIFKQ